MGDDTGVTLTNYAVSPDTTSLTKRKAVSPESDQKSQLSQGDSLSNGHAATELEDDDDSGVGLKRTVGIWSGSALIVGTIIGSGIFISPQGVTAGAGSVGMSMMVWVICGIISLLGALCYAEIGTMMPVSGAEYSYMKDFYGDCLGFLTSWVYILLLQPTGSAVISLTCASYTLTPMFADDCGQPPELITKLLAMTILLLLAGVNCYSVKLANQTQVIFTIAKVVALIIIIFGGLVWIFQGKTENLATGFEGTESDVGKMFMAFYSCFWSYSGWANLNYVTEEIENPSKTLPRAIILGISTVIVVYLLTNLSYYTVLTTDEMLESPAVGVTWAEYVMPGATWIIPLAVALSTFGACNGGLFLCGRLCYVTGRSGHMMQLLGMVHVEKFTPFPAIGFTSILAVLYVIPGDISALMDLFNFVIWTVYGLVFLQICIMKFTRKDAERPFSVNISIPIIMVVCSAALVVVPLVTDPKPGYFISIGLILLGLVFYVPIVYYKKYPPGLDPFTVAMQQLLNVSPPDLGQQQIEALAGLD